MRLKSLFALAGPAVNLSNSQIIDAKIASFGWDLNPALD
jgi:hypothetical protein